MLAMQAQPILQDVDTAAAHLQPPSPAQLPSSPAAATAATATAGNGPPATASPVAAAAAADAKPLILLLDVHLDAPVLLMPLNSSSEDHLEVDLGTLQLSNNVVWQMTTGPDRQKLLMDEMQVSVTLVGIRCHICGWIVHTAHMTCAAAAAAAGDSPQLWVLLLLFPCRRSPCRRSAAVWWSSSSRV